MTAVLRKLVSCFQCGTEVGLWVLITRNRRNRYATILCKQCLDEWTGKWPGREGEAVPL